MTPRNREEQLLLLARQAQDAGDLGTMLANADEAIIANPLSPHALFLAGLALMRMEQTGCALSLFNMSSKLEPRSETFNNIGCCLRGQHPDDAYAAFKKANELLPDNPMTLANLCSIAGTCGRDEEAMAWAEACLRIDPTNDEAIYNSSLSLIALGRWKEGWDRYAVSLGNAYRKKRNYHANRETPRWDPRNDRGETVVIYGEQGLGDEILYASMLHHLALREGRTIIECDARLEELFKRSFPWATIYGTRGSDVCSWPVEEKPEAKLEIGALGEFFAPEPFHRGAFLKADETKRQMVRVGLDAMGDGLKVGIAWTGGTWKSDRKHRSLMQEQLAPLLGIEGVEFVCLEYDEPAALDPRIHDMRSWVKKGADYDDTAALVAELDLVIAPTTSVIDLAGALGVPTWCLVNKTPQWRYSPKAGDDEMWFYDCVRTYRQKERGQWNAPIARMVRDLKAITEQREAAA